MVTSEFEVVVHDMQRRKFAVRWLLNALATLNIDGRYPFTELLNDVHKSCGVHPNISKLADMFCDLWIKQRNNETIFWVIEAALTVPDRNLAISVAESAASVLSTLTGTNENKQQFVIEYLPKHMRRKCKLGIQCALHCFADNNDAVFDFDLVRVPAFRDDLYQHRPDDERHVSEGIIDLCKNPGARVLVLAGEAGVGKTTLVANLLHSEHFKAPNAETVVFWLSCYRFGTESAELNDTTKKAFNDALTELAKMTDQDYPDGLLTSASHIVPHFRSQGRRCFFVFDDVFNEQLLKYFISIQKDATQLSCCAITRDPLPLKVSQNWANVVRISYLEENDILSMFHGVYNLPIYGLSEEQIDVLVSKCCGLPLVANLIWAWFKNSTVVNDAYEKLLDNLKTLDPYIKKDARSFKTVSQLFELSVNQLKPGVKLLYFYLLFFDPGELLESVDLEIFWRLIPRDTRLTTSLFVDRCLVRQDNTGFIVVHQMMWEAARDLACHEFSLQSTKAGLETLRMKMISGLSERHLQREMITFEMVANKRRLLLQQAINRLNAADLTELAVAHSKREIQRQFGSVRRTFIHVLYLFNDWPDNVRLFGPLEQLGTNHSYRLILRLVLKIKASDKGTDNLKRIALATSAVMSATQEMLEIDAFLLDLFDSNMENEQRRERYPIVQIFGPWLMWYDDMQSRNQYAKQTENIPKLVLSIAKNLSIEAIETDDKEELRQGALAATRYGKIDALAKIIKTQTRMFWYKNQCLPSTALDIATRTGHFDIVRYLLEQFPEIPYIIFEHGLTPLHSAATGACQLEIVQYLVELNSEWLTMASKEGFTALHCAAQVGCIDVVRYLVEKDREIISLMKAKDPFSVEQNRELILMQKQSGATALHSAIDAGHLDVVRYLIEQNRELIMMTTHDGTTTLLTAIIYGHFDIVRFLVEQNRDLLTVQTACTHPPLLVAVDKGHFEIARYLIDQKPDLMNMTCYEDKTVEDGYTVLHYAARSGRLEVVRYFVEQNRKLLDIKSKEGATVLHVAAIHGHLDVVRYFVGERRELIPMTTEEGSTAFHYAASNGHTTVVYYLIAQNLQLITMTDKQDVTALHYAAENGFFEIVKYLVEKSPDVIAMTFHDGMTALHLAARSGHFEIVRYLLDKSERLVTMATDKGLTAFHHALENNQFEIARYLIENSPDPRYYETMAVKDGLPALLLAAQSGRLQIVQFLVEQARQAVTTTNRDGVTALHIASLNGHLDIVRYLLERNSDLITTRSDTGETALHFACQSDHLEVVRYLIEQNPAVMVITTDQGITPLHLAVVQNSRLEIVRLLIKKNKALATMTATDGMTALHVAAGMGQLEIARCLIESNGTLITMKVASNGLTALDLAAAFGHLEIVRLFCEHHPHLVSKIASTALKMAFDKDHIDVVKYLRVTFPDMFVDTVFGKENFLALCSAVEIGDLDVVRFLAEQQPAMLATATDNKGLTVFHIAVRHGHLHIAQYLIESRADSIWQPTGVAWLPLHYAAFYGHLDLVRFLLEKYPVITAVTRNGRTALHLASQNGHLDIVRYLVQLNNKLCGMITIDGWSVLHAAAANGQLEIVRFFIAHVGGLITCVTESDETALHLAAENGHFDVVRYLARNFPDIINIPDARGRTAAALAEENHYSDISYHLSDVD